MKSSILFLGLQLVAAGVLSRQMDVTPASNVNYQSLAPDSDNGTFALPPNFRNEPPINTQSPLTPGAMVKTVKYGPWHMRPNTVLPNAPVLRAAVPCTDCYVVAYQADLVDENGVTQNVNNGGWLHHMVRCLVDFPSFHLPKDTKLNIFLQKVLFTTGIGQRDTSCPILPTKRIFASGNERAVTRLNANYKFGYKINPGDSFSSVVELMNMGKTAKTYYMTISYEYLPINSPSASGYREYAAMPWLDATGCGGSDVPARQGAYSVNAVPWISTVEGNLLFAEGHVHDGALDTTIYLNDKPVCISQHVYGRKPEYVSVDGMDGMGGGMEGMPTTSISDTSSCVNFGMVKRGDKLSAVCKYDTTQHPIEKNPNGSLMAIMCNTRVYIG
ncbi:hypothetical protein K402DRAFT_454195 [Aulographum hederae CBS 113979]|uniref:Copper radical oxidase n=1 Tax=Aulographum hederae CBS 113979 TaxID=1176131 RepID=A0A6G1H0I9_9PEZI|nr:hypothetical protein K402DRAFT_454195 [Aulographum hederae CBS 113979]